MKWFSFLVIAIAVFILYYVVFVATKVDTTTPSIKKEETSVYKTTSAPEERDVLCRNTTLASQAGEASSSLQDFFPESKSIPVDYPVKKVGCCPYSKPFSTDLPIANLPMCYASSAKTHLV